MLIWSFVIIIVLAIIKAIRARITAARKAKNEKWHETAYEEASPYLGGSGKQLYNSQTRRLTDHLHELEEKARLKKAEKHLEAFEECYDKITSCDYTIFRDVSDMMKTKKKCINEWNNYLLGVGLGEYSTKIQPQPYMLKYFKNKYDPCMDSREALEKKLDECIQVIRPECVRKTKLYKILVNYVSERESVLRSALLKNTFEGYTVSEVKYTYKYLLAKNQLVEYKLGSRWFVSLSDKQASKSGRKSANTSLPQETDGAKTQPAYKQLSKSPSWKWKRETMDLGRIIRAKEDCTVLSVDIDEKSGKCAAEVKGSTGNYYQTSLTDCSCVDFKKNLHRKSPCKHMICLGMKLLLLDQSGNPQSEYAFQNFYPKSEKDNPVSSSDNADPGASGSQPEDQAPDEKPGIYSNEILSTIRAYLKQNGIAFIDKTEKGGALYFFSEDTAKQFTANGYTVYFAPNGTKGTRNRPAWYMK